MFAVLKTGGKQYRVQSGDVLRVEKLAADAGELIQFNHVLMVGDQVGAPFVAGAAVQATVIDQIKGEKVIHFVRRRRKHSSKRTKGHRQQLTLVRVTDILAEGADATGVKAAIGTGTRTPAATGISALMGSAVATASGAAERAGTLAGAALERVEGLMDDVRERVEDVAEGAGHRLEAVAEEVVETAGEVAGRAETLTERVVDAVEDVTSSTAGRVALGAAVAAGVAAVAAAALGGGAARADDDDTTDDGAAGANSKE
jgi:large subunit ribosomal protein L21